MRGAVERHQLRPLVELVLLYRDPHASMAATQFSMKYAEAAGLVKFDFLGLKTLDVLEKAIELIRARGVKIDLAGIPLRSEEHTSELQSLMRNSYAVFCLKKNKTQITHNQCRGHTQQHNTP